MQSYYNKEMFRQDVKSVKWFALILGTGSFLLLLLLNLIRPNNFVVVGLYLFVAAVIGGMCTRLAVRFSLYLLYLVQRHH